MSAMKRTHSSSRISRLPVRSAQGTGGTLGRSSSYSNLPRYSRSSSAKRSGTNTNLLSVYGTGTLGRSSSYSNLVTPSQKTQPRTPSSASSASKNFKMNDKDWQRTQFQRVKIFLTHIDNDLPALKPLSIRMYVHSMNLLFKQLDNRITITMDNYKDSVPSYLTSFQYPYQLKASVVKSPAVPTSFQYILQMWIWLVNLIELQNNPEKVFQCEATFNMFNSGVDYLADRFRAFNRSQNEEDVDQKFVEHLAQLNNISLEDTGPLDEEQKYLDDQLQSLHEVHEGIKPRIQELSKKLNDLRAINVENITKRYKHRDALLEEIRKMEKKSKYLQLSSNETIAKCDQVKSVISAQEHTKAQVNEIKNKKGLLHTVAQLKQKRLGEINQMIKEYDKKIYEQKQCIQPTVDQINNKIADLSRKAPDLRKLRIAEHFLKEPNVQKNFNDFTEQITTTGFELKLKLEKLKATTTQKTQESRQEKAQIKAIELEMDKMKKIERDHLANYNTQKDKISEQIKELELKNALLEKSFDELFATRPPVNQENKKLEMLLRRESELIEELEQTNNKGNTFLEFTAKNVRGVMDAVVEQMNLVNDASEASLKRIAEVQKSRDK